FHTSNALFFYPDCPRGAPVFPYTTLFRSPELRVLRLAELEMFAPDPVESALRPSHVDPADQDCTDSTCQEEEEERPTRRARVSLDRKSTRLNSSHVKISYAVFCLKKKKTT